VIEEIRTKRGNETLEAESHIANMTGEIQPRLRHTTRYRDTETEEEYLCLAGGFSWPGVHPGYAIVLAAVEADTPEVPKYKALAEVEEKHLPSLLNRCSDLFEKYGKACKTIPFHWYGDNEDRIGELAQKLSSSQFFLATPPYIEAANFFEISVSMIFNLAHTNSQRLSLGPCDFIRGYLSTLDPKKAHLGSPADHPAIAALGHVVTAMEAYRRWLVNNDLPPVPVDEERYLFEQEALSLYGGSCSTNLIYTRGI